MTKLKNPFPRKSVISPDSSSAGPLYTLVTPQVEKASQIAVEYLEDGIGEVITVQGPYGSGKSHLINFVMQKVQQAHSTMDPKPRLLQIYQRASGADFVLFYRELIKQIGFEMLQEVNDRFLGVVALRDITSEIEKSRKALFGSLSDEQKKEIEAEIAEMSKRRVESLRKDPKIIYQYLDSLIIQPEAVYDQRGSELQAVAGENFKKAFFYLPDVNLGRTAYSWFIGEDMTEQDRERLGVSGSVKTAIDAKFALSLLITLFRQSGIRLLIYLDQVEKLLVGTDPETFDKNRGVIFHLAELCPPQNAFLAVAGANDGWELMREDFWSRIGATKVQLGTIPADWARALIKVYVREKEAYTLTSTTEEAEIAPFTFAAADEMLKISDGNARLFLQTCHEVFKKYASGETATIGPEEVRRAVATQFDEGSVLAEIQTILTQKGFLYELESKLNSAFRPDILIGEKSNPLAVVEISNPSFYVDEAETAVQLVNRRYELSREYPRARFIVVTIGYASNEVADQLNRVVDNYLVYDGRSFAKTFEAVLDSLSFNGHATEVTQANVPEVKDDLQELLATREKEIAELNERLQTLAQEQSATQISPRHREWRAWLREDQDAWDKRQRELTSRAEAERIELQKAGEAERVYRLRRSLTIFVAALVVMTLIPLLILIVRSVNQKSTSVSFSPVNDDFVWGFVGFIWIVSVLTVSGLYFFISYLHHAPLGSKTDEIGKYSGDLGQLILRAKTTLISRDRARACLRNPNPIIKYFGALSFIITTKETQTVAKSPLSTELPTGRLQAKPEKHSSIDWTQLAVTENWKPLYLAFLRLTFRITDPSSIQEMLDLMVEANIEDPRILYLIAMSPPAFQQLLDIKLTGVNAFTAAAERLVVHAAMANRLSQSGEWGRTAVAEQPLIQFVQAVNGYSYYNPFVDLANRYKSVGQFWLAELQAPVEVPLNEDELTSAIHVFSPHHDKGLASFPDLAGHNSYLRLYRFFSEIQWRYDQGDVLLRQ